MLRLLRLTMTTVGIVVLLIFLGFAVSAAASAKVLIAAALPFSMILILILRVLGPRPELIAWSALTVWLGSTYLQTGSPLEIVVLCVYMALAAFGLFRSPYLLAFAWLFHPIWDFLPRELPTLMLDLPMACILFDIPIGLYLIWATRARRLTVFGGGVDQAVGNGARTLAVAFILLAVTYAVVALAEAGLLLWSAVPLAIVLILVLSLLGRTAELLAWAVFTGWMGMAFAHTGGLLEALVFFASVALAGLGVFRSPAFLVGAWVFFVPWSLAPHALPAGYEDLRAGAALFALPIVVYLFIGLRGLRWRPIDDAQAAVVEARPPA